MKKHLLTLTSVLIVLSLVLASCNRDDENPIHETIRLPWKITYVSYSSTDPDRRHYGYFYLLYDDQNRIVFPEGILVHNADGTIASDAFGFTFRHEGNFIIVEHPNPFHYVLKLEINSSGQVVSVSLYDCDYSVSYPLEFIYNSNGNLIKEVSGGSWVGENGCRTIVVSYTHTNIPVFLRTDIPQWYLKFFGQHIYYDFLYRFSGKGYLIEQRVECGVSSGEDCACVGISQTHKFTYELDSDGYVIEIKIVSGNSVIRNFIEYKLVEVNR